MPSHYSQFPAAATVGGGGGVATGYRDLMDARRSGVYPTAPHSSYPDGYLGTIRTRRDDRLLRAIQNRLTQRSYQRGVHKGEKVELSDYLWPQDFRPTTGLEHQARGIRWAPKGDPIERFAYGGRTLMTSPTELGNLAKRLGLSVVNPSARAETDPAFAEHMRRYLPTWR